MASGVKIVKDNRDAAINAMKAACVRALTIIGQKGETYAKGLTPVDTGALRNSMTHRVNAENKTVVVGSNVQYAPYVELGTGKLFEPPASWIQYSAKRGRGLDKWLYKGKNGEWHWGYPRVGVHMIEHALGDHMDEYQGILDKELKKG